MSDLKNPVVFNAWLKTLPTRTVQVGEMANGQPLTMEVPSVIAR